MMKYIIAILMMVSFSQNTWACYDSNASDKENFISCKAYAEQGDASAQFLLGGMYDNGQGVTQDYKQAVKWCRKAAEQGVALALSSCGTT